MDSQIIFTASDLCLGFGEQTLFNNASLSVHKGEKVALAGKNGAGKSTFLKILSGLEDIGAGNIIYKQNLTKAFLSQSLPEDLNITVFDYIMSGAETVLLYLQQFENLEPASPEAVLLEEKINILDGWNLDNKVEAVMQKLNIRQKLSLLKDLSGGEKRRVSLAKVLIANPELLILDEPTNHLDIDSIVWLENYVASYTGTVIFVTHDRYFIDKVATRIIELDEGIFYSYKGKYADYLSGKEKRLEIQADADLKRKSFIRRELDWINRQPKARGTKSNSRIKRFNEQVSLVSNNKEPDLNLLIPPSRRLSEKVVEFNNIGFSFPGKTLFENFDFMIKPGMKLGVVGVNGAGKTTFLKLITEDIRPVSGNIERAVSLNINYIDQERCKLDMEKTVYDEISEGYEHIQFGDEKITVWTYLKRYLFEDKKIKMQIKYLSGGEKARLLLAKMLKKGGNFLILDEPTNDLDLISLNALEEAIINFDGCCLIVSHDRYFLDRTCNGILSFWNRKIKYYVGNYSYFQLKFQEHLKKVFSDKGEKPKSQAAKQTGFVNKPVKLKWKEEKELESIESEILELEDKIAEIESVFCKPDFFEKHKSESTLLETELATCKNKVESLYNRWDELEKIKNGEIDIE